MTNGPTEVTGNKPVIDIVKPIGEAVDTASESLAIWRHDIATALYFILTTFEDGVRLPLTQALRTQDPAAAMTDLHPKNWSS